MHAAQNLKKRAFWLNAEEAAELEARVYDCRVDQRSLQCCAVPCWVPCRPRSCCLLPRLLEFADCQRHRVLLYVQRAAELKVLSQLVDSSEHKQRIQR